MRSTALPSRWWRTRADDAPIVDAPAGAVRGEAVEGADVYRGVPYAEPPVNELRWRAPQPLPRWSGVREARLLSKDRALVAIRTAQHVFLPEPEPHPGGQVILRTG